jgi:hypothetical protein
LDKIFEIESPEDGSDAKKKKHDKDYSKLIDEF